ncbi:MAG: hypothetical protein H6814_04105 [Phycisphaeraceae bacterium]|nr:hypothetical protein [Phycisphaeraceae bacterium]
MSIRTKSIAAVAGLAMIACASSASAVILTDNSVGTRAGLLASNSLVPLDLSGVVSGLSTSNSYTQNFTSTVPGAYSGTLTCEVFGNVGLPGLALNQVMMIYTMTGNGPSAIELFQMGVDTSTNIDYNDLLNATHGQIVDQTTGGQLSPEAELLNNFGTNNTLSFNYQNSGDTLGSVGGTETLQWYVLSTADVAIDFIDVTVSNFGTTSVKSLSFVDVPGLPDLNTPTPGAVALLSIAGVAGFRRRR